LGNPFNTFKPTTIPKASFANSVRLTDLVKDGKIYLSLSDAIALALENNYDLAIARYDLDIADTDILRTRDRSCRWACATGLITTLGGSTSTLSGRRSGRHDGRLGRRGFGQQRIVADHRRERVRQRRRHWNLRSREPEFDRASAPSTSFFTGGTSTTNTYNVTTTRAL
jgi:outer membrane protein